MVFFWNTAVLLDGRCKVSIVEVKHITIYRMCLNATISMGIVRYRCDRDRCMFSD